MLRRILWFPIEDWLGTIGFGLLLLLMAVNVAGRYLFNTGIGWSEEVSRYLLIWIIYIGIATGIRTNTHIRVDLIDRFGGPVVRAIFYWLTTVLLLVFLVWLCWLFSDLVGRFSRQRAPASGLSMAYAYSAVLMGAALGTMRLIITRFVPPPQPREP